MIGLDFFFHYWNLQNIFRIKNNENLTENKTKVQLNVILKKKTISFIGRGLNVTSAKRAAAKIALKKMGYSDFVI